MSYESTRVAVAQKFADEWPADTFLIVAENQPFPGGAQPDGPWGRYSIRPIDNLTQDVSATSRQITGMVWLQIFIPETKGTKAAMDMADLMESIFAEKRISTADGLIRFERAKLQPAGDPIDGFSRWQCLVKYRDDHST